MGRARRIAAVAILFAACSLAATPRAPAGLITVAFWSGDGNANSSVGGHTGTLQGGAGYGPGQFGQQAFSLNGSTAFVSVPDSPAWDFGGNPFTIATFVNFNSIDPAAISSGGNALMGHNAGSGPSNNKWFFSYTSDGRLNFHINTAGGSGVFITSPSASVLSTNTWNLLAVTRSGSTWDFFSNGASLGTVTDSTIIPSISAPLAIGQTGESLGYVDGRMQNVAIFNAAMTAAEITAALTVPEPGTWAAAALLVGGAVFMRWRGRKRS